MWTKIKPLPSITMKRIAWIDGRICKGLFSMNESQWTQLWFSRCLSSVTTRLPLEKKSIHPFLTQTGNDAITFSLVWKVICGVDSTQTAAEWTSLDANKHHFKEQLIQTTDICIDVTDIVTPLRAEPLSCWQFNAIVSSRNCSSDSGTYNH